MEVKMWNLAGTLYISRVLVRSEDDLRSLYMFTYGGHLYFICHIQYIYLSRDKGRRRSRSWGSCWTLCILQRMTFFTEKCQVRLFPLNYSSGSSPTPTLLALSSTIFLTPSVPSVSSFWDKSIGFLARSKWIELRPSCWNEPSWLPKCNYA